MFKKQLWMTAMLAGSLVPAYAQEFKQDAAVQITGNYTKETEENGVRANASDSAGFLGTYRYFFGTHHGVEGNYGYTRNTQRAFLGGLQAGTKVNTHEVSAAYVLRFPTGRVTPFALAGVGALVFDQPNSSVEQVTKASFVYGGGADFHISNRAFIRAQYRGQVFNSPNLGPAIVLASERLTHVAQPSVGFGLRF